MDDFSNYSHFKSVLTEFNNFSAGYKSSNNIAAFRYLRNEVCFVPKL